MTDQNEPVTEEDKVTTTLAKIALNEQSNGSYFLKDEEMLWLTFQGIEELALALNHKAVEKQLEVDIDPTSTGIMISWRPSKNARNS
jgi:hypothetical protein